MLRKLLSLIGLTTISYMNESLQAIQNSNIERINDDQKHYKETLDILEKDYNKKISALAAENSELKAENLLLLEDVALALLGKQTKGAKSSVQLSEVSGVKHKYDPATAIKKSSQVMIKKLEKKLKDIPDGAQGTGGIDVIVNGKTKVKSFNTKNDLEKILADAKAGKLEIAEQAGL